jgi:NodT family efflux transporter outer membrane factor (OMF) lipoprotein
MLIAVGCTTLGPEFETPDATVATTWQVDDETIMSASQDDMARWWEALDDNVLNALIGVAMAQNLPLQISAIRIFEARAQLGIAAGNWYPQRQRVNGSLNHVEASDHQLGASPLLDTSFRDAQVGFDTAWELDIWGRFQRAIEAADANLSAEMAGYDDAIVSLTAEVATAYIAARTFEARIKIANENAEVQQRSFEIAETRFEAGATSALDVEQARTLLGNTKASIHDLEINLRQVRNALSILLGLPPGEIPGMETRTGDIPAAPVSVAVGVPADLLRRRPDIRRAESQAAAQSALIGVARADLYPQFSLVGNVGLRASDTGVSDLGDLFDGDSLQAGFGPSLQWYIINYGRLKNAVRVEDARFEQAIIVYQNTVLEAAREVEDALVAFIRGNRRVALLELTVAAAQRAVELALLQYRDGAVDYTRVLDTQTALINQQDRFTDARGQVTRDLVAMYKALGGGWQVREAELLPAGVKKNMDERTDWGELLEFQPPIKVNSQIPQVDW